MQHPIYHQQQQPLQQLQESSLTTDLQTNEQPPLKVDQEENGARISNSNKEAPVIEAISSKNNNNLQLDALDDAHDDVMTSQAPIVAHQREEKSNSMYDENNMALFGELNALSLNY